MVPLSLTVSVPGVEPVPVLVLVVVSGSVLVPEMLHMPVPAVVQVPVVVPLMVSVSVPEVVPVPAVMPVLVVVPM